MKLRLSILAIWLVTTSLAQRPNFIEHYNKFAFELYKKVLTQHSNQVFSPYFVVQNFAPIYLAAKGGTKTQMSYFLGFNPDQKKFFKEFEQFRKIATEDNNLSTRIEYYLGMLMEDSLKEKILPQYLQKLKQLGFDSIIMFVNTKNIDRAVIRQINQTVRQSGINPLPEPIFDNPTQFKGGLVLLSSTLFNGNWETNFEQLYLAPFYLDSYGRKTKSLLYMTVNAYFKYVEGPNYKVIEIPYENNQLSLMIILPNQDVDLFKLQKKITYEDYQLVAKGLTLQRLRVFLPVLSVKSRYALKDTLKNIMPLLFRPGANLTKMIKKLVWISQVYHAVKFDIQPENELPFRRFIDLQSEAKLSKILFINRPFIFFVKDNKTGAILFLGHVYKPI